MRFIPLLMLCTALATFMGRLDTNIVGIALPAIADYFHIGAGATANLMLSYLLTISLLLIPLGGLGDRMGFRKMLLMGYAVFTGGSLFCGLSGSLTQLTAARILQGGGAAMMLIAAYSIIPRRLSSDKVGKAMGVLGTAGSIGILIGAPLGGVLTEWLTWRSIFLINLPVGVGAIWLVWRGLPPDDRDDRKRSPFDWPGCLLVASSVLLLILAVQRLRGATNFWVPAVLFCAGLALMILLLIQQSRSRHPLFDPAMYSNSLYCRALAVQGLMFLVIAGHGFALPFYLDRVMGLSHQMAGLALAFFPVGVSVAAPMAGRMADRIHPTTVLCIGVAGNACATGLFALAIRLGISWAIYLYLPLLGASFGTFLAPSAKLLLAGFKQANQGIATSVFHTVNNVALTFGVALSALVLTWGVGAGHALTHNAAAYFPLYALLTGCCLAAMWLATINYRIQRLE